MWRDLAKEFNAELKIIECVLDEKIHKERVEKRIRNLHGIAEVSWEDVENRKKEYVPWNEERLVIDTSSSHEDNLSKSLEYISK